MSNPPKYLLTFYVPQTHTTTVLSAIHKNSGAGTWPSPDPKLHNLYTETAFVCPGSGQFRPNEGANPNIGTVGQMEYVKEDKVEVICAGEEVMRKAVGELQKAHPYEVVAYFVIKAVDA